VRSGRLSLTSGQGTLAAVTGGPGFAYFHAGSAKRLTSDFSGLTASGLAARGGPPSLFGQRWTPTPLDRRRALCL